MISGNVCDLSYPTSKIRRGRVQGKYGNISPTLTCGGNAIYRVYREDIEMENEELKELNQSVKKEKKPKYKIRKLTPHECHRLMGVSEKDFYAAEKVVSNSQLYKIAGNAIVVPVLCAIFSQLGISGTKRWNDMTLEEKKKAIYKNHFLESKCI